MRQGTTPALIVVVAVLAAAPARGDEGAVPDNWLGYRVAPLLLLSRPDVRADLKLSEAQASAARKVVAELRRKAAALPKDDSPDVVAQRRAIDQEQQEWLTTQLAPDQQARLGQIDLQWEGPAALVTRKGLARSLGLSKDQIAALEAAVSRCDQKRQVPKADWRAAERTLAEETRALLDEDQRRHWLALLGKPIEFRVAESRPSDSARK